jgi:subtilisin-like proprotein convertase family protein
MKNSTFILILMLFSLKIFAQSTTISPDRVSVPKMTTVAKNSLPNKTEGMMVYDSNLQQFSYWTGTTWANFGSTALGTNGWQQTGQHINYSHAVANNTSSSVYTNSTNYMIDVLGEVTSVINVPLTGFITDPNLITISIAINHNYCGGFIVELISPTGSRFILINRLGLSPNGSPNDFLGTNVIHFNNLATSNIVTTNLDSNIIPGGTYLPTGASGYPVSNLADLYSEKVDGSWKLITRNAGINGVGSFISWSITFGANSFGSIGKVGINTSAPQAQLDINGDLKVSPNSNWNVGITENNNANIELRQTIGGGTPYIDFSDDATSDYDGRIILSGNTMVYSHAGTIGAHLFNNGTKTLFTINGNGSAVLAGALTQNSDERLKTNIKPIKNSLKQIKQLNGYTYNWKDSHRPSQNQIGLLAQEIEKILPELVESNQDGIKSVNYISLIPLLLESIKDQQTQIDELKSVVKKLIKDK